MLKLFNHIHASIPLPPIATGVFCEYVTAYNGVFVRSVRPGLEAMIPVANSTPNTIKGLPPIEPYLHLDTRLVPSELLLSILTKAVFTKDSSDNLTEILFHLSLDSSNQWQLTIPLQLTTRTTCQPLDNSSYSTALIECHSHAELPAFFSSTDDADERGFRLYAVLGKVNTLTPEILVRIGIFGHYSLIKANSVFEEPHLITDAYQNSLKPRL
ncbi:hypothetical protein K4039_25065 [Lyngbya sp. CCAP 1446/10]|uniref:hypothetical protein n=1 Tax=Lyngbya sp. CCAP 1446/10 TaxID=439293 RepID=UPI002236F21E|nr:hypothetical protein [Lyngbya sp. CCAP 1446/10]MCW6053250.1 hypothetical protein [Lyngbya sp. CCAP 1446/10]